ncbi:MAG: ABC transporter permease, partial [Phycisphaerae bacterium]
MHKIFVVAMREYIAAVKTKAFVISIVVIPLFYVVGFSLPMLLKDRVDVSDKVVKVVDPTGEIAPLLKQQADTRNSEQIFAQDDAERQVKPKFLIEPVDLNGSSLDDEMMLTLSDEVRDGKLLAFMVIAPDILSRESGDGAVRYYSNRPTYDDFVNWARGPMTRYVQSQRLAKAELDPKVVAAATRPVPLRSLGLLNRSVDGSIEKAKETNRFANFIIPFAVLMLMFMTVMVGASPLMQTVLEEKMQRIAEVLLASVTPFQLMLGKLIGIVGVSVTLSTLYLAGTYFAVRQAGFADHLPSDVVIWFVVFQILSVLMFGSGFAAVGAAVTDLKEAQSLITPLMMIPVLP